jgi:patatin-like phospholipase/acyl hydrolase
MAISEVMDKENFQSWSNTMTNFRIISLDGGGIKGLVEIALLKQLKEGCPSILEKADMLAGTSTGGIVALCLASGMSLDATMSLYEKSADVIFKRNWLHFFGLTGAKYKNDGLKKLVNKTFGDMRLGDIKKRVLISSFDLMSDNLPKRWKPKFFHNFGDNKDDSVRVADIALYTSAAPTYFPSVDGFIDGGLMANNPSMAALCQALDDRYGDDLKVDDVALLSLGTGESYNYIKGREHNFGMLSVGKIVNILLSGTESVPHYQCQVLLGDKYMRLNPFDADNIQMDDIDKIPELIDLGERQPIDRVLKWLRENW